MKIRGAFMYKKFISPLYLLNMIFQSLISLASPIAIMFFFAYLAKKYTEVGDWIYVLFILLGVLFGLYSMICFILKASSAMEALEKQHKKEEAAKKRKTQSKGNENEQ